MVAKRDPMKKNKFWIECRTQCDRVSLLWSCRRRDSVMGRGACHVITYWTYQEDAATSCLHTPNQKTLCIIVDKMGRKPKQPTDYEWTPEREEMLLNFWEKNAFLYNLELRDYSNQDKKRRTYEEFAAKMGATGELAKNQPQSGKEM